MASVVMLSPQSRATLTYLPHPPPLTQAEAAVCTAAAPGSLCALSWVSV